MPINRTFSFSRVILVSLVVWLTACAVPQWKKEYLSDPIMQLDGDPDAQWMKQNILKNREGSTGGSGAAGGGCGC